MTKNPVSSAAPTTASLLGYREREGERERGREREREGGGGKGEKNEIIRSLNKRRMIAVIPFMQSILECMHVHT